MSFNCSFAQNALSSPVALQDLAQEDHLLLGEGEQPTTSPHHDEEEEEQLSLALLPEDPHLMAPEHQEPMAPRHVDDDMHVEELQPMVQDEVRANVLWISSLNMRQADGSGAEPESEPEGDAEGDESEPESESDTEGEASWDAPLFDGSPMTRREQHLTLLTIASKHQFSDKAVEAVGRAMLACAPATAAGAKTFCTSHYRLKQFAADNFPEFQKRTKVYYCSKCWAMGQEVCADANHGPRSYFLQNSITDEVLQIFQGATFLAEGSVGVVLFCENLFCR